MLPLASLLLAVFVDLFGLGVIRPILPLYAQEVFGVDVLRVSWIPAAFGIGKLLADIPAGLLMDSLGRHRLMAGGLLLGASTADSILPQIAPRVVACSSGSAVTSRQRDLPVQRGTSGPSLLVSAIIRFSPGRP